MMQTWSQMRYMHLLFLCSACALCIALCISCMRVLLVVHEKRTLEERVALFRHERRLKNGFYEQVRANYSALAQHNAAMDLIDVHNAHFAGQFSKSIDSSHDTKRNAQSSPRNVMYVMDFWERLVNVQSALKRLVQIGVDADFLIVEPFAFESRVSVKYAFPSQFLQRNLTPQPVSYYLDTSELYATKQYISYDAFAKLTALRRNADVYKAGLVGSHRSTSTSVIDAVLFLDWDGNGEQSRRGNERNENAAFWWCDEQLDRHGVKRSAQLGWELCEDMHALRGVCAQASHTRMARKLNAAYFEKLFEFVRNGSRHYQQQIQTAVPSHTSIAVYNYRKHAFNGYTFRTGGEPFRQKCAPMRTGEYARSLALRFRETKLRKGKVIAVHLRTGKAWTQARNFARLSSGGRGIDSVALAEVYFKEWLETCAKRVRKTVTKERKLLNVSDNDVDIVIATDMFNCGWRGGEKAPQSVWNFVKKIRSWLVHTLNAKRFEPEMFHVEQDHSGIAAATDATLCEMADVLVYAAPSSMGNWAADLRAERHARAARKVNCFDARFGLD